MAWWPWTAVAQRMRGLAAWTARLLRRPTGLGEMRLGRMQPIRPRPQCPTPQQTPLLNSMLPAVAAAYLTPRQAHLDSMVLAAPIVAGANPMPLPMPRRRTPMRHRSRHSVLPARRAAAVPAATAQTVSAATNPAAGAMPARTISPEKPMALVPSLASAGIRTARVQTKLPPTRVAAMEPAMARAAATTPPLELLAVTLHARVRH